MTREEILSKVDHTLLKPEATWQQIKQLCDEAMENHTASICINSCYVKPAAEYLAGRVPVCTVVGFPLGAMSTEAKLFETEQALKDGASEVDMVIHIGDVKAGQYDRVEQEIRALKKVCKEHVLKVIIETCLLTQEEKEKMCQVVCDAGADYIKTSTGFSSGGATFEDIELFARCCAGRCKIKAAGGIRTRENMERFLQLGADRLGTSSAIKILET
ncbi:MAG: deoxyribose-phosphate aldolase [Pygmaiobacter massiliensis]|nr:deoxyribose-phosphate aldolase [Pygmaiobacter massiliensis]